mmetsp:Transcript_9796/g.25733  ORF Transcript_9796/g.25733 Transcript_9796/m.25733 type:complete len:223 (+) Transcript_9796:116-784(+)|eukprot:CAMPEP_0117573286 /NCGR_PEP_ID=MMETSP0784-20121206/60867_1 /TAXON_ID=39447 /ORGANISM="" /LENGTH=222 /DNA_ID=CAMNT_0005371829 /DNA_START=115 /DNA_END=783 /DNA_ORIENTATION=-
MCVHDQSDDQVMVAAGADATEQHHQCDLASNAHAKEERSCLTAANRPHKRAKVNDAIDAKDGHEAEGRGLPEALGGTRYIWSRRVSELGHPCQHIVGSPSVHCKCCADHGPTKRVLWNEMCRPRQNNVHIGGNQRATDLLGGPLKRATSRKKQQNRHSNQPFNVDACVDWHMCLKSDLWSSNVCEPRPTVVQKDHVFRDQHHKSNAKKRWRKEGGLDTIDDP